jgi:TPR repeat protein
LTLLAVIWTALALFTALPAAADKQAGDDAFDANDYAKAFTELLPEAQRGHRRSQYRIGWMYLNGKGSAANQAKAMFWLTKSAEQIPARKPELARSYRRPRREQCGAGAKGFVSPPSAATTPYVGDPFKQEVSEGRSKPPSGSARRRITAAAAAQRLGRLYRDRIGVPQRSEGQVVQDADRNNKNTQYYLAKMLSWAAARPGRRKARAFRTCGGRWSSRCKVRSARSTAAMRAARRILPRR